MLRGPTRAEDCIKDQADTHWRFEPPPYKECPAGELTTCYVLHH